MSRWLATLSVTLLLGGSGTALGLATGLNPSDRMIFDELILGCIEPSSRERLLGIMELLGERGVEGVIVGCTELPLLLADVVPPIACCDTTRLHALAAVRLALQPT